MSAITSLCCGYCSAMGLGGGTVRRAVLMAVIFISGPMLALDACSRSVTTFGGIDETAHHSCSIAGTCACRLQPRQPSRRRLHRREELQLFTVLGGRRLIEHAERR